MTARCLSCENATESTEDKIACLFTEEVVGTLEELLEGDTPKSCPLPKDNKKRNKTFFKHPQCKISTETDDEFACFKKDYGHKKKCLSCPKAEECAVAWSNSLWNTHKMRGYGRGIGDDDPGWHNGVGVLEGD